jgi:Icc-related predicted phosphoesterase
VAFLRLIRNFRPVLAVHGHIHPYGRVIPERMIGPTRVVNAVPWRVIEI